MRAGIPDWIGTDIPVEKYSKFLLKDSTPVKRTELHKLLETGCLEALGWRAAQPAGQSGQNTWGGPMEASFKLAAVAASMNQNVSSKYLA